MVLGQSAESRAPNSPLTIGQNVATFILEINHIFKAIIANLTQPTLT